jgi:hypothetical protein
VLLASLWILFLFRPDIIIWLVQVSIYPESHYDFLNKIQRAQ